MGCSNGQVLPWRRMLMEQAGLRGNPLPPEWPCSSQVPSLAGAVSSGNSSLEGSPSRRAKDLAWDLGPHLDSFCLFYLLPSRRSQPFLLQVLLFPSPCISHLVVFIQSRVFPSLTPEPSGVLAPPQSIPAALPAALSLNGGCLYSAVGLRKHFSALSNFILLILFLRVLLFYFFSVYIFILLFPQYSFFF